jgi:hypothetical protein
VSLSGNLGFVSLDEVLRLLSRSQQRGAVEVKGSGVSGRIYVTKGGVGLATTFTDESLHRHIVKSGLVDEESLRSLETDGSLARAADAGGGAIIDLLQEMSVESLYQMGLRGESFEVAEGQTSRYSSPKPFDLEELLASAKQRLSDWAEVSEVVQDLDGTIRFRRDLGDRVEVKVDRDAWKVLSQVGGGATVHDLAEELGTTDFWTARIVARMIEDDLLTFAPVSQPVPAATPEPEDGLAEPEWAEPAYETAPIESQDSAEDEDVDPDQSWWEEPKEEPVVVAEETFADEPAADTEVHEHEPAPVEEEAPAAAESGEEVADDTEAFLEKVFSELDSGSEADEGYGLLRRRRMGALRDFSNDA